MARRNKAPAAEAKHVDPDTLADAMAKAVADGDIVNLRMLFAPFSPARSSSAESFDTDKYAYLLPDTPEERKTRQFEKARSLVRGRNVWDHIHGELDAKRPARLPSELVMMLGDNAVAQGKYSAAAQAYEMLRIRSRMQEAFFDEGDRALDGGDVKRGVSAYVIGTGLDYDFAAFPEPLPQVPDYQTRALMLHAVYPERWEDCVGLQDTGRFVQTALGFLLMNPATAARFEDRSLEMRTAFVTQLARRLDPEWDNCLEHFREAVKLADDFRKQMERQAGGRETQADDHTLAEEIEEQQAGDPELIPAALLGRAIEGGTWWQYMKELAYAHPAAVLFVSRQQLGDTEIVVPRYRRDCPLAQALGLPSAG